MDTVPDTEDAPLEPAPYGPLPVGSGRRAWARRPATEAEAKAMASPLRLRIVRITLHEPHTNKEIAEVLDLNPASVLHHVRTLVDTGFLIEQPVRRGRRGSRERPYLASRKTWYLDTGEPTEPPREDLLLRTFLDETAALAPGDLLSWRLGFRVSAADRARLVDRFESLLEEIERLPSDPDGEPWSIFLGMHPDASGVRSAHELDRDH